MRLKTFDTPQAIERLTFYVSPELLPKWVELDHKIWTAALAECPGFTGKELWINPSKPGEITTVIYWKSLEDWLCLDHAWVAEVGAKFDEAIGKENYELVITRQDVDQLYLIGRCEQEGNG